MDKTKQIINIVIASDNNYAQHMGIVILSCLNNSSRPELLTFYILSYKISDTNKNKIQNIATTYSATCVFIEPDTALYSEITIKRYGVAALFRLSIDTLLPLEVHKAIYLDCDVLLYTDINELWKIDLENYTIGAVTNLGHQPEKRLGIKDGEYFNSGILLIDLDKWRKETIGPKILEYMTSNDAGLMFPDQDGLNISLKNNWKHLPLRWNQQPATYSMYAKKHFEKSLSCQDYHEAIFNPAIVHFLGKTKPWTYLSYHPLKETYLDYIKRSPWNGFVPSDLNLVNMIKKWLSVEKNIKRFYRKFVTPEKFKKIG